MILARIVDSALLAVAEDEEVLADVEPLRPAGVERRTARLPSRTCPYGHAGERGSSLGDGVDSAAVGERTQASSERAPPRARGRTARAGLLAVRGERRDTSTNAPAKFLAVPAM